MGQLIFGLFCIVFGGTVTFMKKHHNYASYCFTDKIVQKTYSLSDTDMMPKEV